MQWFRKLIVICIQIESTQIILGVNFQHKDRQINENDYASERFMLTFIVSLQFEALCYEDSCDGAAGFIGSSLALEILRRCKDAEVLGLDNMNDTSDPVLRRERLLGLEGSDAFRFVCADIADKAAVRRVFEIFRPEVVVNMAAQSVYFLNARSILKYDDHR